jgi:hypothetical protein
MALKVTQQGKYLAWGLSALGLAMAVVAIERLWVTDNERIENVVYELRRAVLAANPDAVLTHLTPDVEYVHDGVALSGEATQGLIRENLARASFDFVHVQDLQTSAGRQTRRGKAEFRVYAKGTLRTSLANYNVGTANSTWSLGLEETALGVWKVNRITPVALPDSVAIVSGSSSSPRGDGRGPGNVGPRGLGPLGRGMGGRGRFRGGAAPGKPGTPQPSAEDGRGDPR